jgi:hypothetical protein
MKALRLSLLSAILIIVLQSAALIRLENQRYAMQVGLCEDKVLSIKTQQVVWDNACLERVETRTNWLWHLFYALT